MSAVRSAEKQRPSSCTFADTVATLTIHRFKETIPGDLLKDIAQTVLSGVILRREYPKPQVEIVAYGSGTKFLRASDIIADHDGRLLHDCHGEPLARRAFVAYLYDQIELFMKKYGEMNDESVFELNPITNLLKLKPGMSFHIYTSSQPCGNASLKRWAKPRISRYPDLGPLDVPDQRHSKAHFPPHSVSEGQIDFLLKHDNTAPSIYDDRDTTDTGHMEQRAKTDIGCDKNGTIAPGTAPLSSRRGRILSCSDKMAKWNAVGVQGGLLSVFLEPIYIRSITVGRKFSEPHCARALCCRLQDFTYDSSLYCIHHPTMLGTGVKLDHGIYDNTNTGIGAEFGRISFMWKKGMPAADIIDGSLGREYSPTSGELSTSQFSSFDYCKRFTLLYQQWFSLGLSRNSGPTVIESLHETTDKKQMKRLFACRYERAKHDLAKLSLSRGFGEYKQLLSSIIQ